MLNLERIELIFAKFRLKIVKSFRRCAKRAWSSTVYAFFLVCVFRWSLFIVCRVCPICLSCPFVLYVYKVGLSCPMSCRYVFLQYLPVCQKVLIVLSFFVFGSDWWQYEKSSGIRKLSCLSYWSVLSLCPVRVSFRSFLPICLFRLFYPSVLPFLMSVSPALCAFL